MMDNFPVLTALLAVIASILLLGLTILVHEFGHYLAARLCGMTVDVFSIGFGPALWKIRRNNITYKIAAIPFGGYVALPQMEPPSAERRERDAAEGAAELAPVSAWKKIAVSLAGATGNVLLALALAWIVYAVYTPDIQEAPGVAIGMVETGSAAHAAGLRPGDRILAVNGERATSWTGFLQVAALADSAVLRVQTGDEPPREIVLATEASYFDIKMIPGILPVSRSRIEAVNPDSPAERAGLRPGDVLLELDGAPLTGGGEHLIALIGERSGRESRLAVQRGKRIKTVTIVPEIHPEYRRAMIGIRFGHLETVQPPLAQLRNDAAPVFRLLRALFRTGERREATRGVGGPVSVLTMLWLRVSAGLLSALTFTRFLNVNLAIINLLPIPVLDGGHIVFALFEGITRRDIHPRLRHGLIQVFAGLLIALMLLLTYRDVFSIGPRLWRGPPPLENNAEPDNGVPEAAPVGP